MWKITFGIQIFTFWDPLSQKKRFLQKCLSRCQFRSAVRVGPSGHGWPYSGDQGLVTIVRPTVIVSVLPTLAANTGNQRCARPSAQLWPRLEPTVGPTLANFFRWPWQFSRPTSGPRLNQSPGGNLQPAQHRASTASGLPALA